MDKCQASTVRVRFWGQPSHFPRAMQASSLRCNQRLRLWQRWWLSAVICEDCGGPTHPAVGSFAIFYHQTRRTLPRRGPIAGCTGDTTWTCRSASECWLQRLWPGQTGNCLTSLKTPDWENGTEAGTLLNESHQSSAARTIRSAENVSLFNTEAPGHLRSRKKSLQPNPVFKWHIRPAIQKENASSFRKWNYKVVDSLLVKLRRKS